MRPGERLTNTSGQQLDTVILTDPLDYIATGALFGFLLPHIGVEPHEADDLRESIRARQTAQIPVRNIEGFLAVFDRQARSPRDPSLSVAAQQAVDDFRTGTTSEVSVSTLT